MRWLTSPLQGSAGPTVGMLAFACTLVLTTRSSAAQSTRLFGVVVDSASGAAVQDASVLVAERGKFARTDSHGRFALEAMPAGRIELVVRRIGYRPSQQAIVMSGGQSDSVSVGLVAEPDVQRAIAADESEREFRQGIEDFYLRRAQGLGYFVARDQLESARAMQWSEVVTSVPGVRVNYAFGGDVRFASPGWITPPTPSPSEAPVFSADCTPAIWLDGKPLWLRADPVPSAKDLEGIELYIGRTTPRALWWRGQPPACGTIALWSRPRPARRT